MMVTLCNGCGHRQAAAFAAPADLVAGLFEFDHADGFLVGAGGQQRGLVQQVGQLGAGITRGAAGDDRQIHGGIEFHVLGVDF